MEGISKEAFVTEAEIVIAWRHLSYSVLPLDQASECFTIHTALVAHQSAALHACVNGCFKEAIDSSVEWDDIKESTFTSFWQYVYTGDYDTPELRQKECDLDDAKEEAVMKSGTSVSVPEKASEESEETSAVDEQFDGFHCVTKKGRKNANASRTSRKEISRQEMLWNDFRVSWVADLPIQVEDAMEVDKDKVARHSDVFVHHSQVYILADRYGIVRLMNLSCRKLHAVLLEFDTKEKGLDDIVRLLRFCSGEQIPERLKDLVVHYAACIVEKLWECDGFRNILETKGCFSEALIGSMLPRLD